MSLDTLSWNRQPCQRQFQMSTWYCQIDDKTNNEDESEIEILFSYSFHLVFLFFFLLETVVERSIQKFISIHSDVNRDGELSFATAWLSIAIKSRGNDLRQLHSLALKFNFVHARGYLVLRIWSATTSIVLEKWEFSTYVLPFPKLSNTAQRKTYRRHGKHEVFSARTATIMKWLTRIRIIPLRQAATAECNNSLKSNVKANLRTIIVDGKWESLRLETLKQN